MKPWIVATALIGIASANDHHVPGDFDTIQAAIDSAKSGDQIIVKAGRYEEQITLKPGIHLISAGDDSQGKIGLQRAEKTILENSKSPIVSLAENSSLNGFTITGGAGGFDEERFAKHYETRGENLADEEGAVGFEDSAPIIVIDDVSAKVSCCIVTDNGRAGISVTGSNNRSEISHNRLFRNMGSGVGIANGAKPVVTGNYCFQNLRGGIGCRKSAPIIRKNYCYNNVRAGIGIREGATPLVEDNLCYENRRAGIGVRMPETEPLIRRNKCYRNGMAGIGCRNDAAPWIVDNDCYENRLAGIGATANARPVILGNRIFANGAAAIGLDSCDSGAAIIRGNQIKAKKLVAIGIQSGWRALVEKNEISREGGMPPLVMVFAGAAADFKENTFVGSGVAAIRNQGQVFVSKNTFQCPQPRQGGPPQWAVWALPDSMTSLADDNQISAWKTAKIPAIRVGTRDELQAAIKNAQPGQTILIDPGTYRGGLEGSPRGEKGKPIILAASDVADPPVFEGGSNAFHFRDAAYLEIRNLVIRGQSGNGINLDDGGAMESPAHDILLSGLTIQDIGPDGNRDGIKLSGVDDFRIENCRFERWGNTGSGIDIVGGHRGSIWGCYFAHHEEVAGSGIQTKGGSQDILIRNCEFIRAGARAVNLGGSTGLPYFRPLNAPFEAANIVVTDCRFSGSQSPIAFTGVDGAVVRHNEIKDPERWVFRILQESEDSRFVPCRNGRFENNLIHFSRKQIRSVVNIGSSTSPESFRFLGNAWFCDDDPGQVKRLVKLPSTERDGFFGQKPPTVGPRIAEVPQPK